MIRIYANESVVRLDDCGQPAMKLGWVRQGPYHTEFREPCGTHWIGLGKRICLSAPDLSGWRELEEAINANR